MLLRVVFIYKEKYYYSGFMALKSIIKTFRNQMSCKMFETIE